MARVNARVMLVLHSHIPYVKRQGRWPFGEVWLFEAMAETYVPLLQSWARLREEGIYAPFILSLSPTLLEQLNSSYIKKEFVEYLKNCESRAAEDERYFLSCGEKRLAEMAAYYHRFYRDVRRDFSIDFDQDLIRIIKFMQDQGYLEVITTGATHAYLPLLDLAGVEKQVFWGKRIYEKYFEREPRGFWLPECGYRKGLEDLLIAHGFEYFYVDSHAIEGGKPLGVFSNGFIDDEIEIETFAHTGLSTYRSYRLRDKPITVFGRNAMVSHQVWSAEYGYPGDEYYREFHKQAPRSGLKYWRVTDRKKPFDKKDVYDISMASDKVKEHALHFVESLEQTTREAKNLGFNSPLIVGCYDTELFGHWWWEGVSWLEEVMREINRRDISLVLPSELQSAQHEAQIFDSSWGMGGKHFIWDNKETGWMWDIINKAGREFDILKSISIESELGEKAVAQALKELMLIQSSDWLFMVTNNLTRDYAMKRFFEHYTKFLRLSDNIRNHKLNEDFAVWFEKVEYEDDLFSCI